MKRTSINSNYAQEQTQRSQSVQLSKTLTVVISKSVESTSSPPMPFGSITSNVKDEEVIFSWKVFDIDSKGYENEVMSSQKVEN